MGWLERNQQMYMIRHAADSLRHAAEPTDRAAEIFVKLSPPCRGDHWFTLFCGEDQVVKQVRVSG